MSDITDPRRASIDWTRRDVDIAKSHGLSREGVRLLRASAGVGPSPFHRLTEEGIRLAKWVIYFRPSLSGRITQKEFLSFSDTSLSLKGAVRVAVDQGFRFLPSLLWYERLGINLDLPNVDLERIWSLSYNRVATTRYIYNLQKPRWHTQGGNRPSDPSYHKAVLAEILKARVIQYEDTQEE